MRSCSRDGVLHVVVDLLFVVGRRELALLKREARAANFGRLGERPYGGRRERVRLDLGVAALLKGLEGRGGGGGWATLGRRPSLSPPTLPPPPPPPPSHQLAHELGGLDVGDRIGDRGEGVGEGHGLGAGRGLRRRDDVGHLLRGERELAVEVGRQVLLERDVVRQVLQGDRGLDGDGVDALGEERRDKRRRRAAVGPHRPPVDDARAQALARGEAVGLDEGRGRVLVGRPGDAEEVERDRGDRQLHRPRVGVPDVVVVGDQVDGHADGGQGFVGRLKVGPQRAGGLVRQNGFVHLHLGHAQRLELLEHGDVVRDQGRDGGGLVQGGALDRLGEADQGVGPDEDRHRGLLADRGLPALDAVDVPGEVGVGGWKGGG